VGHYDAAATLFPQLTHDDINRRYQSGARVIAKAAEGPIADGNDVLFLVDRVKGLKPVTTPRPPTPGPGDTVVVLVPVAED
jgi:hypothetical protein